MEYLNIPENDTGIKTQRYKTLINLPIKLNEKADYLITGMEYNRFDMGYSQNLPFDKRELIRFHIIDLNVGLITKWNENWNLVTILTPRMASNFVTGTVTGDFFMNATATLWKERANADKPYRIVLGLTYNSTTGLPVPLPLINYSRRFHPDWSFTLGIPKSGLTYYISDKHSFEMALLLDGYYINLQNNIPLENGQVASKISLTSLLGTFIYEYRITKRMSLFAMAGRTVVQEGILRNDDEGKVFLLNDESNFYIRTGLKIGIF
ncbi:DUF6268 family outer membrane beta-barrel protein [Flagellimonas crocea]|uniref:DUF6268 family outer membrane beta-barrel protein n=1 Tax=Flagellimonas crocea TaxID=3067311 RepID=UPI00296E4AA7|nr:DUF6268 family outer membrane beta-barrel protein [Muricauda sp. DH64]